MRARVALVTLLATLALPAAPAESAHDFCHTTRLVQIDVPGGVTFYYEDRSALDPVPGFVVGPGGTWIWRESNGIPGLQRGGQQWIAKELGLGEIGDISCEPPPWDENWL